MKAISLEDVFAKPTTDISSLRALVRRNRSMSELRHAIGEVEFDTAYDFLRSTAIEMVGSGEIDRAIRGLEEIDALITRSGENDRHLLDIHAALMQILTALFIEKDDMDSAMSSAASTLTLLSQEAKRKDEPFLQILGALLYDIAFLHTRRKEYKQAERELSKALKIYERLARNESRTLCHTACHGSECDYSHLS